MEIILSIIFVDSVKAYDSINRQIWLNIIAKCGCGGATFLRALASSLTIMHFET